MNRRIWESCCLALIANLDIYAQSAVVEERIIAPDPGYQITIPGKQYKGKLHTGGPGGPYGESAPLLLSYGDQVWIDNPSISNSSSMDIPVSILKFDYKLTFIGIENYPKDQTNLVPMNIDTQSLAQEKEIIGSERAGSIDLDGGGVLELWQNSRKTLHITDGKTASIEADPVKVKAFLSSRLKGRTVIRKNPGLETYIEKFNDDHISAITYKYSNMDMVNSDENTIPECREFISGLYNFLPGRDKRELLDRLYFWTVVQMTDYGFILYGKASNAALNSYVVVDILNNKVERIKFTEAGITTGKKSRIASSCFSTDGRYFFMLGDYPSVGWVLERYQIWNDR